MNLFKVKYLKIFNEVGSLYIVAGIWNTLVGYVAGVYTYKTFENYLHITFIGLISNIISITSAFLVYKIFVFKTKGDWMNEYAKCYLVYGVSAILSTFFLWIFTKYLGYNIWLSQALSIFIVLLVSFVGNLKFTFKKKHD